ncbi:MAG: hypothetical protein A3A81_00560 [Omnitrophica bacterium RIFCSPLOWO2_01_FULL_45_10b]|nr:MAG: hypothetical protein A3A81_00560 [Omnitrophica bacterium RIFCSPLOWO2_01_FULL_45_10b]
MTSLILHVGAGTYPKNLERAKQIQKKLKEICEKGYRFLKTHTAVETVVEIVRWLEDWPETNAGTGAMLQSDGAARLSASLMDGHLMRFSAIINVERIKNPILLAQLLQKEEDRILASEGANLFTQKKGVKFFDPRTKESLERWQRLLKSKTREKYGTVGVCALDRKGHLAAATSTGGKGLERAGRVSDSALPAGNFANSYAAISATGLGEDIVEESLASTLVMRATDLKNLSESFCETFRKAKQRNRRFAAIGLDKKGNTFWNQTTEILYYAFQDPFNSGIFHL